MTRAIGGLLWIATLLSLALVAPVAAQENTADAVPAEVATGDAGTTATDAGAVAAGAAATADGSAMTDTRQNLDEELRKDLNALIGESIDLDAWLELIDRAERVIDRDQASSAAIEDLRAELVSYRTLFIKLRDENGARIRTIRAQIDELGPVPETGEEARSVAITRLALTNRLDQLMAPVIAAQAAFGITDGLVAEIDALRRARRIVALTERGPTPVNPESWPKAATDLGKFLRSLGAELTEALGNEVTRAAAWQRAPRLAIMLLAGLYFLIRGHALARKAGVVMRRFGGRGSGVWDFVTSLGRIVLPFFGIVLSVNAIRLSGIPGVRIDALLNAVPVWAGTILCVAWLRERLFSAQAVEEGYALAPAHRLPEIRVLISVLAAMLVLAHATHTMVGFEQFEPSTVAVLQFPIIVVNSLLLFRLGMILGPEPLAAPVEADAEEDGEPLGQRVYGPILPALRWLSKVVAVAAPVLAGLGYIQGAFQTLYPMIWTLALFGAVVALHIFFTKFFVWASGRGTAARESLIPALAGVLLVVGAVPLAALIWGVRPSDLQELWTKFLEGVQIGETRISPVQFLTFLLIFLLGYAATRLLQSALRTNILPKTAIEPGGRNAIVSGTGYVGIFLAALVAISSAGLDLSSLAIVAGALSVGVGFGLQTIVSNFVSGIILLVERPIAEGDWIEVGAHSGIVKDISVRATRIETFDRMDVVIPNSDLISGTVTNYTRTPIGRVTVPVGVAYGSDTRKVEGILREIAEGHPLAVARPAPFVLFSGFGADSLDFEVRVVIRDVNWSVSVRNDLNHTIAERFAAEGIEIPFAQRDIWLRNPEALAPAIARRPAEES